MLAYFPTIYPDELLYSVLARYRRHAGSPGTMHTLEALFGNRKTVANFDLPGHLRLLADRVPAERKLSVDRMIDTLTLYPYFTAFEPPSLQTKVRSAMRRGDTANIHIRLGLVAFRIGRIEKLRFCPACVGEMHANYGELYWRRDHQLPSVLVCPEHGCPLLESTASLSQCSRHEFVAATSENCPTCARSIVSVIDQTALSHLLRLARLSAELLDNPPMPCTFCEWTNFYRSRMLETGLSRSAGTMHQQRLDEDFRSFYGRTLELLPGVKSTVGFAGDWLAAMVRKHRKANHPLYHLLIQDFLTQREPCESAFGTGPWQCLNPLASHRLSVQIKEISKHRNRGNTVGVFTCTCGYVYTRCFYLTTNKLGPPRFLRYGPLLEPALRRLVAAGSSLREIGRALQLDPKTVTRLARELEISVPWKLLASGEGRAKSNTPAQDKEVKRPLHDEPKRNCSKQRKSDRARHDWSAIDQAWLMEVTSMVAAIRQEIPPIRITVAEFERRFERRGWILKRRRHLPRTMIFLDQSVEGTEEFQLRRILWAIDELERDGGVVRAWLVMRKAGLRSNNLEKINAILETEPPCQRYTA